jgi:hypothetical protein
MRNPSPACELEYAVGRAKNQLLAPQAARFDPSTLGRYAIKLMP